jgi:tRNA threonylcarbamoyladenosine biosynthesis protein TsaB
MIVLGIDTATLMSAVGVVRDECLLGEAAEGAGAGHAARLPALVAQALEQSALNLQQVDAIAVSTGPGSFTGLRVGLGFAKGIAFAASLRIVGVSTLEALAAAAPSRFTTIATVTDARRGETYLAMFRRSAPHEEVVRVCEDVALPPREAAERVVAALPSEGSMVVLGDAAERYPEVFAGLRRDGLELASFDEIHPRGGVVAALGKRRLALGDADHAEALVPVYVRAPAAERNLRQGSLTMENAMS